MSKTAVIKLGEQEYTIKRFNAGELRQLSAVFRDSPMEERSLLVLSIAMKRAEPKVEDFWALEFELADVAPALDVIRVLSGLEIKNPQLAAAGSTQT